MHTIIWQYHVTSEKADAFIAAYGPAGPWVRLFQQSDGYVDTQLLRDVSDPTVFVTLDRWTTMDKWKWFRTHWREAYVALDTACDTLTESEEFIVAFSTADS